MINLPKNEVSNKIRKILSSTMSIFDDEAYIGLYFYLLRGRSRTHLHNPEMLFDKINWLKLNYRNTLLKQIVDKYKVRDYVKEKIGNEYLNELYFEGEEINKEQYKYLPEKFVLKARHGSSMNLLVSKKSDYDLQSLIKIYKKWLATDYYKTRREWAYKDVPHRLVCEKLLSTKNGNVPEDYKIFCFNGKPRLIEVDFDRFGHHTRNFYDLEWNRLPIKYQISNNLNVFKKPENLPEMIIIAAKLAEGLPFARVDLYSLDQKKIIFGEITIYPGSGSVFMWPLENEYKYGKLLDLRCIEKNNGEI